MAIVHIPLSSEDIALVATALRHYCPETTEHDDDLTRLLELFVITLEETRA